MEIANNEERKCLFWTDDVLWDGFIYDLLSFMDERIARHDFVKGITHPVFIVMKVIVDKSLKKMIIYLQS